LLFSCVCVFVVGGCGRGVGVGGVGGSRGGAGGGGGGGEKGWLFTLEQATKAQRGSKGIAPLFL